MANTFNNFGLLAAAVQTKAPRLARQTCSDIVTRCRIHSRVGPETDPPHVHMRDAWQYEMEDPYTGVVFNDSDHVLPNEYGAVHMPAQPMLAPSIDEVQQAFEAGIATLLEL